MHTCITYILYVWHRVSYRCYIYIYIYIERERERERERETERESQYKYHAIYTHEYIQIPVSAGAENSLLDPRG
jgi:hypothetical protein